jgi:predicted membrane protein
MLKKFGLIKLYGLGFLIVYLVLTLIGDILYKTIVPDVISLFILIGFILFFVYAGHLMQKAKFSMKSIVFFAIFLNLIAGILGTLLTFIIDLITHPWIYQNQVIKNNQHLFKSQGIPITYLTQSSYFFEMMILFILSTVVSMAFGILFIYIGVYFQKARSKKELELSKKTI